MNVFIRPIKNNHKTTLLGMKPNTFASEVCMFYSFGHSRSVLHGLRFDLDCGPSTVWIKSFHVRLRSRCMLLWAAESNVFGVHAGWMLPHTRWEQFVPWKCFNLTCLRAQACVAGCLGADPDLEVLCLHVFPAVVLKTSPLPRCSEIKSIRNSLKKK